MINNKGRRNELTQLKFEKRLKLYGVKKEDGKFYCFKSTGKPCSCYMCSGQKYNRKVKHKDSLKDFASN